MLYPIIDFDKDNNNFISKDIEQDRCAAFGNRSVLNKWAGSNFWFQCDNGLGTENFYNPVTWSEVQGYSSAKYYWGEDTTKKLQNKDYIFGAAPFVYSEFLYDDPNPVKKLKTVFLPKSDYPFKTNIKQEGKELENLIETLMSFLSEDTVYIVYPLDLIEIYPEILPDEIAERLFCFGYNGFDISWVERMNKVLRRSYKVYTPSQISSNAMYSTYFDVPIEFYDHNVYERGEIPEDEGERWWQEMTATIYTVVPDCKTQEWRDCMKHLKDSFASDGPDKYFWMSKFMSLDRLKTPEDLYHDLELLHQRFLTHHDEYPITDELLPFKQPHDLYDQTKEKCDRIIEKAKGVSDTALKYFKEL